MNNLSEFQIQIMLTQISDKDFDKMPEAWMQALSEAPLDQWPLEMVNHLKDYLPQQGRD